jgi:Ca2+-binding RTX toxin-like protein
MTNYTFGLLDGNTTLSNLTSIDTITFGIGFDSDKFSFLKDGDDLVIYTSNATTIRLTDQLLNENYPIQHIAFAFSDNINLNVDSLIIGTTQSETLSGTSASDNIFGGTGNNTITGGAGNDIIYGGAGNDTITGGAGTDTIYGNSGNDTILGSTGDLLYGGSGNDVLRGTDGEGIFDGGDGEDKAWWRDYQHTGGNGISVDLTAGTATDGDSNIATVTNIENITGSVYADTLNGDANANIIRGGGDRFGLTDGDDLIYGQGGNDYLYGDKGDDTVYGGQGIDRIYGNNGNDNLHGDEGADKLWGGSGTDRLWGDDGNDYLYGNAGTDTLIGGKGLDFLYGGTEIGTKDIFGFSANEDSIDRIINFELGTDEINITDLLTGYIHGISDIGGFVEIVHTGSRFDIRIDSNGGADNFSNTARILTDISNGLTAQDLLDNGDLIANQSLIL